MMSKGKTKKEPRPAKRPYKFTLDEARFKDVIIILDSVPKPFRSEYIAESIRFARNQFGFRNQVKDDFSQIKGSIEGGAI